MCGPPGPLKPARASRAGTSSSGRRVPRRRGGLGPGHQQRHDVRAGQLPAAGSPGAAVRSCAARPEAGGSRLELRGHGLSDAAGQRRLGGRRPATAALATARPLQRCSRSPHTRSKDDACIGDHRRPPQATGPRILLAEARRPLRNVHGRGMTAGTSLEAAALSLARGASGVWLRAGSRLGLACRGTVYLLVGYLAFRLALAVHGRTGAPASSAGAVQAAVSPAWGRIPLVLLVAGLAAYALTQLLEAVFRPSRAESAAGRWRQRAVSSWGCLLYSAFCLSTARLLLQTPPRQTAQSEQRQDIDVTATVLRTGWGQLLLILAGLLIMAAAVEMGRRSVWLDFRERFTAEHMSRPLAMVTRAVGAYGCIARSVVLALVGFFIIKAAVLSSAEQVKGLDAVFRSVAASAGGAWLLAFLACGLFCYGLYCLIEARYRDLTPGR